MKSSAVTLISWALRGLLRLKEILFPVNTTDFKLTEARNRVAGAKSVAYFDTNAHSQRDAFSLLLRCNITVSTS